jgi:hypothetical protein
VQAEGLELEEAVPPAQRAAEAAQEQPSQRDTSFDSRTFDGKFRARFSFGYSSSA